MTTTKITCVTSWHAVASCWLVGVALAQDRPRVLELSPPHLAIGVDAAACRQLTVTFDRDMDQGTPAVGGGGPGSPKVVRTRWQDARTFVLEVELEADHAYGLELAGAEASGCRSSSGQSLRPAAWRFATRGQPLPAGAAALTAERLFQILERHYSYRDRLGIDWSDVAETHHDSLLSAPDGAALALRTAEVLATAQDPHISVRWNDTPIDTWQRTAIDNIDLRSVQKTFPKLDRIGRSGLQATTDDGIGYLYVPTFGREHREDFDLMIEALRKLRGRKALVLDLRANSGGDELLARRLAAFFVRGDKVYAAHRVRDPEATDGFRPREDRVIRGNEAPDVFAGPVAVLTGPWNIAGSEAFLLMMKQAERAILIGTESYGSSGNPLPHTLHVGLQVMLPSWQALRPDGTMYEGEGIAPHIHVPTRPEQLLDADPVLQEALLRLRGQR